MPMVNCAQRDELDGPEIESWWGGIFHTRPHLPWGPPSLLYNDYRRYFPGAKAAGACRWPPISI